MPDNKADFRQSLEAWNVPWDESELEEPEAWNVPWDEPEVWNMPWDEPKAWNMTSPNGSDEK